MVKLRLAVKVKKQREKPVYVASPLDLFRRFKREVNSVVSSLNKGRKANRVLGEFLKEEKEVFNYLEEIFARLEGGSVCDRKKVCDVFYRIFQRLRWAEEAGSEREIELRGWVLSSLDLLIEVFGDSHGRDR